MALFADQFYTSRAFSIVDDYYTLTRETEKHRFKEIFAAVKIQGLFRMYRQYKRYNTLKAAVDKLKKYFKGFRTRKMFWRAIEKNLAQQRFMFYSSCATVIQRVYRGFYSRKYIHDFWARKKYITHIERKNEKRRDKMNQYNQTLTLEEQRALEDNARMEFHKLATSLHHLTSTRAIPGVYKQLEQVSDFGKHSLKAK
jgi:hypothetical protein